MFVLNQNIDEPTVVQLGIYVNSFYSFNEQTMVRVNCFAPRHQSIKRACQLI